MKGQTLPYHLKSFELTLHVTATKDLFWGILFASGAAS